MPLFSIIIPVYKVEKYIKRSLESVREQTESDFECILIDDGSPDNCGAICDWYGANDSRFHVIHQNNMGVSAARNAGLQIATGKYVVFIDPDDEVLPTYLEAFSKSNADLVIAGYEGKDEDGHTVIRRKYESKVIKQFETADLNGMFANESLSYTWGKRYVRSQIHTKFDVDFRFAEDTLFELKYLKSGYSLEYLEDLTYIYYKHPGSLTSLDCTLAKRQIAVNRKIEQVLEQKFKGYVLSQEWNRRKRYCVYTGIYGICYSEDLSFSKKVSLMKELIEEDEYWEFAEDIDYFMEHESAFIKSALRHGNAASIVMSISVHSSLSNIKMLISSQIKKCFS